MDFNDRIKQLAERVEKLKESLQTEEATKNALIMPFIQAMGYDVFNPLEVMPEFTCDIGTKKGEKIDYAILQEGTPIILIECKHWKEPLTLYDNQLLRYYHVSPAKFGILTNGICYRFYTDLETPNKMDEKPFLEVDITNMKANQIEELKKFQKSGFDIDNILSSASELKYMGELRNLISKEFANPSPELVKLFARQVYGGQIKQKVLDQFTVLVRKSIANFINDMISDRLKAALKTEEVQPAEEPSEEKDTVVKDKAIVTTGEEMEAYYIVKSILHSVIASDRIAYRDAQNYFSVMIDDNNRKIVCRLYLNSPNNKRISFMGEDKKEIRYPLNSLDDIYDHAAEIVEMANKFI
ncbi:MAG: type I restriction enzyme HsdR N-terminal domain-containing protein [Rikenellaceae bacterium]|nr:type I restriction enzyme HsdR N-terminal domain-containing protein [Rikenellaceae bacterium]